MANTPTLSIIVIIHDQHKDVESTLSGIYEHLGFPFELFIVDDASTDESTEIIKSIIEYHDHADTFYFEYDEPSGYGIRLQQIFTQISGDFLWVPGMFKQLDGNRLAEALQQLSERKQLFGLPGMISLPKNDEDWIKKIAVGKWPGNHHFLWNLNKLPNPECYFQPRLDRFHSFELALRTTYTAQFPSIPSFSSPVNRPALEQPDTYERRELLTTLIQFRGLSTTHHELAGQVLFDKKSSAGTQNLDPQEATKKLDKANKLIENGEIVTALSTLDAVLASDRNHTIALGLKISVLEKMKRYVEASELKFRLREQQIAMESDQEMPLAIKPHPQPRDEDEVVGSEKNGDSTSQNQAKNYSESRDVQHDDAKKKNQDEVEDQDQQFQFNKESEQTVTEGDHLTATVGDEAKKEADEDTPEEKSIDNQIQQDIEKLERKEPDLELDGLDGPKISIIVPTTLDGKPFLEQCMISVSKQCNADYTEVIIIDNASLDDTYAYLNQLKEDQFFDCTVLTNTANTGFAAACNQGLEAASGQYVCILHNDVMVKAKAIDEMAAWLDAHPEIGIIGPKTNYSIQPKQLHQSGDATLDEIEYVNYIGSFCMMMRSSANLRLDEQFNPAFFEDIDLCLQAADAGWKVAICTDVELEHEGAITTEQLGLFKEGDHYWLNAQKFQQKWDMQPDLGKSSSKADPLEQLCNIADIINPYHPENNLKALIEDLLDDETRARIQNLRFDASQLIPLITIMMMVNERQLLRRLEDQIEPDDISEDMALKLIHFYYERNIYSRCHHYIKLLPGKPLMLPAALYRLKITIGERNIDAAVGLLNELMERYPSNVILLKAASDIHSFSGDDKEAAKFKEMANQAAPFLYSESIKK